MPVDITEKTLEGLAFQSERVMETIGGKTVRKVVVVPGRLVNVLV